MRNPLCVNRKLDARKENFSAQVSILEGSIFSEELVNVFHEADGDHHGGTCQSDEKQDLKNVHREKTKGHVNDSNLERVWLHGLVSGSRKEAGLKLLKLSKESLIQSLFLAGHTNRVPTNKSG